MKPIFAFAAILTLGAATLTPLAAQAQGAPYLNVQYGYDGNRYVAPPARFERVPQARRGYVWQRGHWERRGHRNVWIGGHWVRARPMHGGPGYGHYDGHHGGRDNDRDGVPNRYDRDRDGDGVPNRHDRRPDNPRR